MTTCTNTVIDRVCDIISKDISSLKFHRNSSGVVSEITIDNTYYISKFPTSESIVGLFTIDETRQLILKFRPSYECMRVSATIRNYNKITNPPKLFSFKSSKSDNPFTDTVLFDYQPVKLGSRLYGVIEQAWSIVVTELEAADILRKENQCKKAMELLS